MIITFDKGIDTEKSINVDHISEHVITGRLNGTRLISIGDGTDLPDLSAFSAGEFSTIEVVNDNGVNIPISGNYTHIVDVSLNYSEIDDSCNISIVVA